MEKDICFAFEDEEANREIRELRELSECNCALNFHDLYPEVQRVTIIGCNELAWCFARYLQNISVPVKLEGEFWEHLCVADMETKECLNYNQMTIWAEGTWRRKKLLKEELLRSVSVEFPNARFNPPPLGGQALAAFPSSKKCDKIQH